MRSNHYELVSHWRVRGSLIEVSEVIGEALSLPRWWPSVCLDAKLVAAGAPKDHRGGVIELRMRGALPLRQKETSLGRALGP